MKHEREGWWKIRNSKFEFRNSKCGSLACSPVLLCAFPENSGADTDADVDARGAQYMVYLILKTTTYCGVL
jgi:hypothetical protein